MDDDVADVVAEAAAHQSAHGLATVLAQPFVVLGDTLGRGAGVDVEPEAGRRQVGVAGAEALFEGGPARLVVTEVHVDADAVEGEEDVQGVGNELGADGERRQEENDGKRPQKQRCLQAVEVGTPVLAVS